MSKRSRSESEEILKGVGQDNQPADKRQKVDENGGEEKKQMMTTEDPPTSGKK
jgi:hypothetical protein